jgi:hypothetical protein
MGSLGELVPGSASGSRCGFPMNQDPLPIKVVGRKGKPKVNLETANEFLHLMKTLRDNRPFIPRGVWRFKTFVEAGEWTWKFLWPSA